MSAEVERLFSSAKRLLTADRNRLLPDTIETLELLRYWYRRGVIDDKLGKLEAVETAMTEGVSDDF
jgi:hypothetical protein